MIPDEEPAKAKVAGVLISRDPLILWGPTTPPYLAGPGTTLAPYIGNRRAYFLFSPAWTREHEALVRSDIKHISQLRAAWPEHRHVVLCATRAELELFRSVRQPAVLCTANVFVNEHRFTVQPERERDYDALYNGQLVPFKRHELCVGIERLALIYHRWADAESAGYAKRVRAMLPSATFVNELDGEHRNLKEPEILEWLSRAHVGLCLSAEEGQNRSTAEYVLSGLPVVSTPNLGGRNGVLHPSYWIEAAADPAAVAAAVQELKARRVDPHAIRAKALELLAPDRERLLQLIRAIYRNEGRAFPEQADWDQVFRRGTWPVFTAEKLMAGTAVSETTRVT
jgi:glycosyltransferase involved in cell wall biosynthesis